MTDIFECAQASFEAYPDDMSQWPDMYQKAAHAAADRELKRHPGARIIAEKSYCMTKDHPRFPDDSKWPFFYVYEITISDGAATEAA
jgi:hypothetical protein